MNNIDRTCNIAQALKKPFNFGVDSFKCLKYQEGIINKVSCAAIGIVAILFGAIPYCIGAPIKFVAKRIQDHNIKMQVKAETENAVAVAALEKSQNLPTIVKEYKDYIKKPDDEIQKDVDNFFIGKEWLSDSDVSPFQEKINKNSKLKKLCGFLNRNNNFNIKNYYDKTNAEPKNSNETDFIENKNLNQMMEHLNFKLNSEEYKLLIACFSGTFSSNAYRDSGGGKWY